MYQFLKPVSMSLKCPGEPRCKSIHMCFMNGYICIIYLYISNYLIYIQVYNIQVYVYIYMYIFYDIMGIGNFYVFAIDTCDVKQI